jgi:hypothetical protein
MLKMREKLTNEMLSLKQKRGMASAGKFVYIIIGVLIVVVILVALAPTIFSGLGTGTGGLQNTTSNPDSPTWFGKVLIVVVSAGLLFLIWRLVDGGYK